MPRAAAPFIITEERSRGPASRSVGEIKSNIRRAGTRYEEQKTPVVLAPWWHFSHTCMHVHYMFVCACTQADRHKHTHIYIP